MPIETINLSAVTQRLREEITQTAHGFAVGQVLRCDNTTPNTYALAQADTEDNAKAVAVVTEVVNANEFVMTYAGRMVSGVPAQAQGTVMYLSDVTPGAMVTTAPTIAVRILEISENNLSAIVNIDWKGGAGGAFIPLAGTNTGSPVTGDIEIDNTTERFLFQDNGTGRAEVRFDLPNGQAELSYRNAGVTSILSLGEDSARIAFEDTAISAGGEYYIQRSTYSDSATYPVVTKINGFRCDFNGLSAPTVNDDNLIGYAPTSFRIYNGVLYVCTDATTGAAVWVASGGGVALDLEVNGTPNGDQTLLNLAEGTGIDIADNGTGTVTITNTSPHQPAIVAITRSALQTLLTGGTADTTVIYRVTNAVGSTLVLDVFATANNAISGLALDQTNLRYLFYNISADTIIDLYIPAIASVAQGDVMFYNGTAWTRLAAGTSGNQLTTGGSGANPSWTLPIPNIDAGGTADAITATYAPAITLADNLIVAVVAGAANATATPTFAPNGLTAHTIVKWGGQPLVAGDIPGAQAVALLRYDLGNTRWELLNPAGNQGWIDWSGSSNPQGGSSITTNNFRYRPAGYKKIECIVNIRLVSNSTTFTFDLPVAAANTFVQFLPGRILSGGTSAMGYAQTAVNSITVSIKTATGGDPSNSGNKEYSSNFFIETI